MASRLMISLESDLRLESVTATFDGFSVTISNDPADCRTSVNVDMWHLDELAEAFERHDGSLLGALEYHESAGGGVELSWEDYDQDEEPVGGRVVVAADDVAALRSWLSCLPRPITPEESRTARMNAEFASRRAAARENLYAGLPDRVDHDGVEYLLWARDGRSEGLYGLLHAEKDDPRRWMLRSADGTTVLAGTPLRLDRRGRAREWRHPRAADGKRWVWVRSRPVR